MTPDTIIKWLVSGNPFLVGAAFAGIIYVCLTNKWLVLGPVHKSALRNAEKGRQDSLDAAREAEKRAADLAEQIREMVERDRAELKAENDRLLAKLDALERPGGTTT